MAKARGFPIMQQWGPFWWSQWDKLTPEERAAYELKRQDLDDRDTFRKVARLEHNV